MGRLADGFARCSALVMLVLSSASACGRDGAASAERHALSSTPLPNGAKRVVPPAASGERTSSTESAGQLAVPPALVANTQDQDGAPPPPPPEPGRADLDPANDDVVAPPDVIDDCEERLRSAGVTFRPGALPVRAQRGGFQCGAPQAVVYQRGPGALRFNAPPVVPCGMALALAAFERVVQEEALRTLGKRVLRVEQGGTYSCRKMARFALVSEHSYGNAIDIRAFTLEDGRRVSIERHFGSLDREPTAPEGLFLRALARRLYDEGVFSVVLTRYFDALHRDHFHLDLARYRIDGTR